MVCSKKSLSYPSPQQATLSLEATNIIRFLFILRERFLCFYKHFSQNDRCMYTLLHLIFLEDHIMPVYQTLPPFFLLSPISFFRLAII